MFSIKTACLEILYCMNTSDYEPAVPEVKRFHMQRLGLTESQLELELADFIKKYGMLF
jgi:hypothetical protein